MTVQNLLDELMKVKNRDVPVILSHVNTTWSGGCGTCGYGATKDEEEVSANASNAYDFVTRFVIESKK